MSKISIEQLYLQFSTSDSAALTQAHRKLLDQIR